jgi:hypothetical protein
MLWRWPSSAISLMPATRCSTAAREGGSRWAILPDTQGRKASRGFFMSAIVNVPADGQKELVVRGGVQAEDCV